MHKSILLMPKPVPHKPMKKVKVGDRVRWLNSDTLGTIQEIYLFENPFYVRWDKGTEDWYKGEDLTKVEQWPEKVALKPE